MKSSMYKEPYLEDLVWKILHTDLEKEK
jgi:hypothetical protein